MTCIWRIHGSKPYIVRWSLVYNTSVFFVFHTFIWRGWVGGLSQMKLTSFEKTVTFWDDPLSKNARKTFATGNAIYPLPRTIIQITNDNSIFRKEGIGQWGMKLRYQQEYCPSNISYNLFWWYETGTAMNARESENYMTISRSSSASKSVEMFWAEIYLGRLFLGPNLVSFNRVVVPLFELSFLTKSQKSVTSA
jgi:hypothetical protein